MGKKIVLLLLGFVLTVSTGCKRGASNSPATQSNTEQAAAQAADAGIPASGQQAEAARAFVQEFYKWYIAAKVQSSKAWPDAATPEEVVLKQKRSVLAPELLKQLDALAVAAVKNPEDHPRLGFDPYLNAQDYGERYTAGKVSVKGSTYGVEVYSYWDKRRHEDLTAEVEQANGQWRFVNFHYVVNGRPTDLLTILEKLNAGTGRKGRAAN